MYGKELILDLHNCDAAAFTKTSIADWFGAVCKATDMEPIRQEWWESYGHEQPHLNGITAVQFISTSSITIHSSVDTRQAHINVFTCKDFDPAVVREITRNWFKGSIVGEVVLGRP